MARARDVLTLGSARLLATLRAAPGTLIYLFTLMVTQLTLSTVDDRLGHKLLVSESTNLVNMKRAPVQVLIGSAFWIDGSALVTCGTLAALLVVLVPLERWVGTARWLVSIATGHIGATLLTLVVTTSMLRRGLLSPAVTRDTDVGVSYVLLTALGLLAHAIPARAARWAVATVASGGLAVELFTDTEILALGHLLSFLIGFALFPLVPAARRAAAGPAAERRIRPPRAGARRRRAGFAIPAPRTASEPKRQLPAAERNGATATSNGQVRLAAREKS